MLARIPDQSRLASDPGRGKGHLGETRAEDGSSAFIYSPSGKPFTVDLERLSGKRLRASWIDPRTGEAKAIAELDRAGRKEFRPPSAGDGPVWGVRPDGTAAHAVECLRNQCAMDGSRAAWRPSPR